MLRWLPPPTVVARFLSVAAGHPSTRPRRPPVATPAAGGRSGWASRSRRRSRSRRWGGRPSRRGPGGGGRPPPPPRVGRPAPPAPAGLPSRRTDNGTPAVPNEVLAEAERRGFPVLGLPSAVRMDEVLTEVLGAVVAKQAQALALSSRMDDEFMNVALSGGGLE